jgi:hypothetical protein
LRADYGTDQLPVIANTVRDWSVRQPMLPSARTFHVKRFRLISELTLAFFGDRRAISLQQCR